MRVLKAMVSVGSSVMTGDTIEWQDKLWLVPAWNENLATRTRQPRRIVRVGLLPHQLGKVLHFDLVLNEPVPREVLDGVTTSAQGRQHEVVEDPPIQMPMPDQSH